MANNCLVTKLKCVVDNENLIGLNAVKWSVSDYKGFNEMTSYLHIGLIHVVVRVTGSGKMANTFTELNTNYYKSIELNSISSVVYLSDGDYNFIVEDKNAIKAIVCKGGYFPVLHVNINDLKYNTELYQLNYGYNISGNIENLSNKPSLNLCYISHSDLIKGDIKDIKNIPTIQYISITYCNNVFGKLEDFLVNLIPTKNGNIDRINFDGTEITFNNQKNIGELTVTFSSNGCIVNKNSVTIGTYSNGTWTYN